MGSPDAYASVTLADYEAAIASATFAEQLKIALTVRGELSASAAPYSDVPAFGVAAQPTDASAGSGQSNLSGSAVDMVKRLLARHNAQQTKRSKEFVARLKSLQGLAPEDLRLLGVTEAHLDELRQRVKQGNG